MHRLPCIRNHRQNSVCLLHLLGLTHRQLYHDDDDDDDDGDDDNDDHDDDHDDDDDDDDDDYDVKLV